MKLFKGNTIEVKDKKVEAIPGVFSAILVESYDCEPCMEDVNLIELANNLYVCEEDVKNRIDLLWLNFCAKQIDAIPQMLFHDKRIMENEPCVIGHYVDKDSLVEISDKLSFKRKK